MINMDLIKNINNAVREKDAVEAAIEETEPKEKEKISIGKPITDYIADIKQEK